MPTDQPIGCAPHDGSTVIVSDLEGVEAEACWSDDEAFTADDPCTAGGYWRTEAGYMTRDEAVSWQPSIALAIRVHGG